MGEGNEAAIARIDDKSVPKRICQIGDEADPAGKIAPLTHFARESGESPAHLPQEPSATFLEHDKPGNPSTVSSGTVRSLDAMASKCRAISVALAVTVYNRDMADLFVARRPRYRAEQKKN